MYGSRLIAWHRMRHAPLRRGVESLPKPVVVTSLWEKPPVELPTHHKCEQCGFRFRPGKTYLRADELLTCPFCNPRNEGPKKERDRSYKAVVIFVVGGYILWKLSRILR